jgi:hypothetical protein
MDRMDRIKNKDEGVRRKDESEAIEHERLKVE